MRLFKNLFLIVLFASCNSVGKKEVAKITMPVAEDYNVVVYEDSLEIKIDSLMLPYYLVSTSFKNKYYGYNPQRHSLDIFSLVDKKIKTLFFDNDGPNEIERVHALDVVSKDSIFLLSENYIYLLDKFGKMNNKIVINYKSTDSFFNKKHFYVQFNSVFKYNKELNNFFITTIDMINGRSTQEYYKNNIVSEIFIGNSNSVITETKLSYSNEYISNHYGFNDLKYFSFNNNNRDSVLYIFSALKDIFSYNFKNKKTTRYQVQDNLPNNNTYIISWKNASNIDKKFKSMNKSSSYGPLLHSNNYVIRFYQEGLEHSDFSLLKKKKKFISIFDNNLNLIKEFNIKNNRINQNASFVIGDNIYVPKINKNEDYLSFLILKIKKE